MGACPYSYDALQATARLAQASMHLVGFPVPCGLTRACMLYHMLSWNHHDRACVCSLTSQGHTRRPGLQRQPGAAQVSLSDPRSQA